MRAEKHHEALAEVKETIEAAISDPRSLVAHQRRLMAMISLGAQHLIELYLHQLNAIKPGAHIKHDWFRLSRERIELRFKAILTLPFSEIEDSDLAITLASEIESDRNELVYGTSVPEDKLRRKISLFLELEKVLQK